MKEGYRRELNNSSNEFNGASMNSYLSYQTV